MATKKRKIVVKEWCAECGEPNTGNGIFCSQECENKYWGVKPRKRYCRHYWNQVVIRERKRLGPTQTIICEKCKAEKKL